MGVEGIAIATILIQLGIVLYVISEVRQSSLGQQLRFEYFKPQHGLLRDLIRQGLPSTISMMFIALEFLRNLIFHLRLRQKCGSGLWCIYKHLFK